MSIIFLVSASVAETSAGVLKEFPYLWDKQTYYPVQDYVDGANPVESTKFCGYCRSNTCGSLYGDPVCNELD